MEKMPVGETSSDTMTTRRNRMRAQARGLRPAAPVEPDGFQTPQWLERSFVLPLTEPEATDVPHQPVPHHDDYSHKLLESPEAALFVRPPTREIDFARVIRRSDTSRTATRAAVTSTGAAGLALIAYLLLRSPIVLGMALTFGLIAVVAAVVRLRLDAAPIPHLEP